MHVKDILYLPGVWEILKLFTDLLACKLFCALLIDYINKIIYFAFDFEEFS